MKSAMKTHGLLGAIMGISIMVSLMIIIWGANYILNPIETITNLTNNNAISIVPILIIAGGGIGYLFGRNIGGQN